MLGRRAPALPLLRVDLAPALAACTGLVCLELEPQARPLCRPCSATCFTHICYPSRPARAHSVTCTCSQHDVLVKQTVGAVFHGQQVCLGAFQAEHSFYQVPKARQGAAAAPAESLQQQGSEPARRGASR